MDEKYYCDVCDTKCSGIEPYVQHMNSSKHKKKVEQGKLKTTLSFDDSYFCETCGIHCSGIVPYKQHLWSEKHMKKEQSKLLCEKYSFASSDVPDHQKTEMNNTFSESALSAAFVKKKECNNLPVEMVYKKKDSTVLPVQNSFQCFVCDKKFTGPVPYDMHMNSSVHKKNLKKIELQLALKFGENNFPGSEVPPEYQAFITTSESRYDNSKEHLASVEIQLFKCDMCEKSFPSVEARNLHMLSSAHKTVEQEAISPQNVFTCELCNKSCTGSIPYSQHMNSSVHHKNVKKAGMSADVSSKEMLQMAVDYSPLNDFVLNSTAQSLMKSPLAECFICRVKLYSKDEVAEHYESESHNDNQDIYDFKRKVKVFVPEEPFDLTA